jgi:hypothetical protein
MVGQPIGSKDGRRRKDVKDAKRIHDCKRKGR